MSKLNKTQSGFTLVETLVALLILSVGLIPALQQATLSLKLSNSIRNSLVAANLAQEGVEVVRSLRDANWLATPTQPFDTGLTTCTTGCLVQFDSLATLPLGGNPLLRIDATSGLYQYTTGNNTLFRRQITITKPRAYQLDVVSQITWQEYNQTKTFSVEYFLFDWFN